MTETRNHAGTKPTTWIPLRWTYWHCLLLFQFTDRILGCCSIGPVCPAMLIVAILDCLETHAISRTSRKAICRCPAILWDVVDTIDAGEFSAARRLCGELNLLQSQHPVSLALLLHCTLSPSGTAEGGYRDCPLDMARRELLPTLIPLDTDVTMMYSISNGHLHHDSS